MEYFDDEKKEKYIPYVVEPSLAADRVTLAFLCAGYDEENIGTEEKPDMRTVLHFHPALAPVKIGVLHQWVTIPLALHGVIAKKMVNSSGEYRGKGR